MRTPITYYGGKQRLVPIILPLIPQHVKYVEPFAGGAAVFFAKGASKVEVLNDINGNVSNFYRVMKMKFDQLADQIEATLHCEYTYNQAKQIYRNPQGHDDVIRAWAFWCGATMSFGSNLFTHFQISTNKSDHSDPGIRTRNKRKMFRHLAGRLDKVMVLEKDALVVLDKYNQSDTFAYIDPPYIDVNQGHYQGYKADDFENLLQLCSEFKGKFLLSSYDSDLLQAYTKKNEWVTKRIDQRLGVKGNKQRKTEVLTANYHFENNLFNL